MLRPNFAMDPPPTELSVGGSYYPIDTDYRTWLRALGAIRKLNYNPKTIEAMQELSDGLMDLQVLVFGGVLTDESPGDVLDAITGFLKGYPGAPVNGSPSADAPTISFEYDLNEIIIAIQDQHGVDCSYRRTEPLHWWEFLLLFNTLAGEHYILRLSEIRGYTGNDKEMRRRKNLYALPVEFTAEEQAEWDEFSAQFAPREEE